MRPLTIGFVLLLGPSLAFVACSQDPTSQTAGSSDSSSSGTGGAPNCDAVTVIYLFDAGNSCDVCLHDKCCGEVAACPDKTCLDCVNLFIPACKTNPTASALFACVQGTCYDPCHPDVFGTSAGSGD